MANKFTACDFPSCFNRAFMYTKGRQGEIDYYIEYDEFYEKHGYHMDNNDVTKCECGRQYCYEHWYQFFKNKIIKTHFKSRQLQCGLCIKSSKKMISSKQC